MNILYSSDNGYVSVMGVSITSLFENNKDISEINVYIIGIGINTENVHKLQRLAEMYGRKITIIDASEIERYLDSLDVRFFKGNRATWYRLFLGRLLPDVPGVVLYLDCDTIILKSLKEIESIKLGEEKVVGMTRMETMDGILTERIGLPHGSPYYQAGVILIDMVSWRELGCDEKLSDTVARYGACLGDSDQAVINYTLSNHIQSLPMKYNFTVWLYDKMKTGKLSSDLTKKMNEAIDEGPVIVHFVSWKPRPWNAGSEAIFTKEWRDYKAISPWKDEPLWKVNDMPIGARAKKFCRTVLLKVAPRLLDVLWGKFGNDDLIDCETCKENMQCHIKQARDEMKIGKQAGK